MKRILLGFLGSKLDRATPDKRWDMWRPSVALCQHEDLLIDQFDLLIEPRDKSLAHQVVEDIAAISPETRVNLHRLSLKDPWDLEEVYSTLHDFVSAYPFETENNEYLVHITTGSHVQQICFFLLTESRHIPGQLIQTSPGNRSKSNGRIGTYRLINLDLSRYDQLAARFKQERQQGHSFLKSGIATKNPAFNQLIEQIERVAMNGTAPVLLTGPTGAGKSQLAKRIFELKRLRKQVTGNFFEVNCATLRGDSAMSTLFGHVKGAFTGAVDNRKGLLASSNQGVLFLDEIGELRLDEQAMLLRAIEEKKFTPVGSDKEVSSDFQLLAGTNRDLREDVKEGRFREDLLARINLWTFRLPGLKDRREDIAPNLRYEIDQFAVRTGRKLTMNHEATKRYLEFANQPDSIWSANFRDLNASVIRMATLCHDGRITLGDVESEIERLHFAWARERSPDSNQALNSQTEILLGQCLTQTQLQNLDHFDSVQLAEVIRICRQSKSLSDSGRKLFSASRQTKAKPNDADRLRKYLARFDLTWEMVQAQPGPP